MNSRVLPLLALLLAIGIFFAYVRPTWSGSIQETKTAITADDAALAAAQKYLAQQSQLAGARAAIDPNNLAKLSTFLPDSVDNVGMILDLNALAARSQLSLANINVMTGDPGSGAAQGAKGSLPNSARPNPVSWIDLSLSGIGTYSAFQAFVTGIEKSARLLDIRDLSVKGSDTGVYSYKMTLRLYWLR